MSIKIYRIKEVSEITGLKPSSIYKQIRLKLFPPGIKLTARSTGWTSDAIDAWLSSRIKGQSHGT
jgi:predicted DNA-binding transcriptional regulator AlpA